MSAWDKVGGRQELPKQYIRMERCKRCKGVGAAKPRAAPISASLYPAARIERAAATRSALVILRPGAGSPAGASSFSPSCGEPFSSWTGGAHPPRRQAHRARSAVHPALAHHTSGRPPRHLPADHAPGEARGDKEAQAPPGMEAQAPCPAPRPHRGGGPQLPHRRRGRAPGPPGAAGLNPGQKMATRGRSSPVTLAQAGGLLGGQPPLVRQAIQVLRGPHGLGRQVLLLLGVVAGE